MKEIIFPNYEHSILNSINSILKYYNVETKYNGLPKLDEILRKQEYKNIVFIVLDGMGEHILKDVSPNGFLYNNRIDKITSVFPSTTVAAMTTYYSGKPPIETGWIAWSQYFKEYGRTIDMFTKQDSYTGESFANAKKDVFDLMKYTTIFEKIENGQKDVKAYEINGKNHGARSARNIKADNVEIMCDMIKSLCKNDERKFIFAYNDNPDGLLHDYGCKSKEVKDFINNAQENIEHMCKELEGTNTLVMVSADHGHKDIDKVYYVLELQEIQDCLIMPPSLEPRTVSFWVKEDKKDKFENFFAKNLKDEYILYTKEHFLDRDMLGYGVRHRKIDDFIGNYIAISADGSVIKLGTQISKEKKDKMSTHCGLTPNEMEVPLIVVKC